MGNVCARVFNCCIPHVHCYELPADLSPEHEEYHEYVQSWRQNKFKNKI